MNQPEFLLLCCLKRLGTQTAEERWRPMTHFFKTSSVLAPNQTPPTHKLERSPVRHECFDFLHGERENNTFPNSPDEALSR